MTTAGSEEAIGCVVNLITISYMHLPPKLQSVDPTSARNWNG